MRPVSLLKKRFWHSCLPVNFPKFLRPPFFTEHLRWFPLYFGLDWLRSVQYWLYSALIIECCTPRTRGSLAYNFSKMSINRYNCAKMSIFHYFFGITRFIAVVLSRIMRQWGKVSLILSQGILIVIKIRIGNLV